MRVLRLMTVNSVEEHILAAAKYKLNVDSKVRIYFCCCPVTYQDLYLISDPMFGPMFFLPHFGSFYGSKKMSSIRMATTLKKPLKP